MVVYYSAIGFGQGFLFLKGLSRMGMYPRPETTSYDTCEKLLEQYLKLAKTDVLAIFTWVYYASLRTDSQDILVETVKDEFSCPLD